MSLLDKLAFLKTLIPNIIEILKVVMKCLQVVLESDSSNA